MRRGGRSSTPIPRGWLHSHTQQGTFFTFSLAVNAQGGVRLCAEARQGNGCLAKMAHAIRSIVHAIERAFDLLQLEIGTLPHEIVDCQVAFGCGDVEDIGGKLGFSCWRSSAGSLSHEVASFLEQMPAKG